MPPSARNALQPLSPNGNGFNIPRNHGGLFFVPGEKPYSLPGPSRASSGAYTPQQIRRKITVYLQNSGTLVKDFKAQLGVGDGTYSRFMREHGNKTGWESDTFVAACEFFRDREARGLKMPKPSDNPKNKKASSGTTSSSSMGSKRKSDSSNGDDTTGAKKQKTKNKEEEGGLTDVSDIHLDGEEDENVPVYNTCDEIRKKIRKVIGKPGVTQAAFARVLSAQYPQGSDKNVSAHMFRTFLARRGAQAGAESNVFYAAYVWLEKERVKLGKKKDAHREEMEDVWGDGGMDRMDGSRRSFICKKGSKPVVDEYGKMRIM